MTLPYYGVFDDLAFRIDGGTVTLMGQVTRPTLKSDAERVVKRIEGVTNVVNQIEVLPLSSMDDQTRIAVYRAIYGDSALSTGYGYRALPSIHILVKNGNVTLEGVVANQMDKQIAETRAKGVPNVFSVTNDLQVEGGGSRLDRRNLAFASCEAGHANSRLAIAKHPQLSKIVGAEGGFSTVLVSSIFQT